MKSQVLNLIGLKLDLKKNNLFRLHAVAKDGVLSGHALRFSSNNSGEQLAAFHIDDGIQGNTKAVIIGNEFIQSRKYQ